MGAPLSQGPSGVPGRSPRGPEKEQIEQSLKSRFPANPPLNGFLVPTLPPPLRLVWPGWRGWLWASDTLESPRSELRAWPPSQANSRQEGGDA